MTHRLQASTRWIATAVALVAAAAAADVVHTADGAAWSLVVAVLLGAGGILMAKLNDVALEVDEEAVVVHNLLATHRVERTEVEAVVAGRWRSTVLLADGTELPTLLRDRDLGDDPLVQSLDLIDLSAVETTV